MECWFYHLPNPSHFERLDSGGGVFVPFVCTLVSRLYQRLISGKFSHEPRNKCLICGSGPVFIKCLRV